MRACSPEVLSLPCIPQLELLGNEPVPQQPAELNSTTKHGVAWPLPLKQGQPGAPPTVGQLLKSGSKVLHGSPLKGRVVGEPQQPQPMMPVQQALQNARQVFRVEEVLPDSTLQLPSPTVLFSPPKGLSPARMQHQLWQPHQSDPCGMSVLDEPVARLHCPSLDPPISPRAAALNAALASCNIGQVWRPGRADTRCHAEAQSEAREQPAQASLPAATAARQARLRAVVASCALIQDQMHCMQLRPRPLKKPDAPPAEVSCKRSRPQNNERKAAAPLRQSKHRHRSALQSVLSSCNAVQEALSCQPPQKKQCLNPRAKAMPVSGSQSSSATHIDIPSKASVSEPSDPPPAEPKGQCAREMPWMAAASSVALREAVRKLGAPSVVLLVNRVLPAPRPQGTQPPIKVVFQHGNQHGTRIINLQSAWRQSRERLTRFVVRRSPIAQLGVFTQEPLDVGELLMEYTGEVIRRPLADLRERRYTEQGVQGCYMFRLDEDHVVDATCAGNIARFTNHSCRPNCIAKITEMDGHQHIFIFAARAITACEELTYDYCLSATEAGMQTAKAQIPACLCGAPTCLGRM